MPGVCMWGCGVGGVFVCEGVWCVGVGECRPMFGCNLETMYVYSFVCLRKIVNGNHNEISSGH